jgi:adenylate cyclase
LAVETLCFFIWLLLKGIFMTNSGVRRKLSAILSADVKGYSRLMADDEAGTVETLKQYREVLAALIHDRHGRVVDDIGDNLLAEFTSVIDATQCAAAIQDALEDLNAKLADHRKMEFRIGINLGDVIEDGDWIYGDEQTSGLPLQSQRMASISSDRH